MKDFEGTLRMELRDKEYSEGYAESFLNSYIATQIKVIREQREMTQAELGQHIGTTQAGVSRYENVSYSSWSIKTLIRLARAFHVRLKVSFEPFGSLPEEVIRFDRKALERVKREDDPGLMEEPSPLLEAIVAAHPRPVDIGEWKVLMQGGQKKGTANGSSEVLSQIPESSLQQSNPQEALCM